MALRNLKIDFGQFVPIICKSLLSKLNEVRPSDVPILLDFMGLYGIGNPPFYEVLALEFVRNVDKFDFSTKCYILKKLAISDIDASNVIKTAYSIISSSLEAFALQSDHLENLGQIEGEIRSLELPPGLYSDQQEKFIRAAHEDIVDFQQPYIEEANTNMLLSQGTSPEAEQDSEKK